MVKQTTKQQTLCDLCNFKGVGIHSGKAVNLNLYPSLPNTGIIFIRTDLDRIEIPVSPKTLCHTNRATHLKYNGATVRTPEHLLAALYGLGIHNCVIELDAEEVPILDGSARSFVEKIEAVGIDKQGATITPVKVADTIKVGSDQSYILIEPDIGFTVSYTLSYPHSFVGTQKYEISITSRSFKDEISSARTYGFESEISELLKRGLAIGGSLDNAVVIGDNQYLNALRYPDELVRHKILDVIGDMAVLGTPIVGKVTAYKSGHELNAALVQAIYKQYLLGIV